MVMPELPDVGDEFVGYVLRAVIGRGAMSVVYEADDPRLGHGIALKVLAAELAADDIFRTRFLDESQIAASMSDPHIIPVYNVGTSDGLLYIAMHRVSGGDLRQKIVKHGPLEPQVAVFLLSQAARALDAAHRTGLVHRDLKPENLLLEWDDDADAEHLYLADFGISRLGMERNGLTSTGQFLGTTDYVAPEQISEPYVYGPADQYSLGCILFECLTGQVPFGKDPDRASARPALRAGLPPAIGEVFARVLAERPGDRYNTCSEFMEAAAVALAGVAPGDLAHGPTAGVYRPEVDPAPAEYRRDVGPELAPVHGQRDAAPVSAVYQRDVPPTAAVPAAGTGRHRARWLVIAAVLLLICAGGGAGAWAARSSHPKAAASMPSAMASKSPMPRRARVSLLTQVLTAANESEVAMGMLRPSTCKSQGATAVTCSAPWPAIASVRFTTYPTLTALFSAYKADIRSLNHGRYRANVEDCGLSAPSPYDEVAWNHREQHSRAYTVKEMIAGKVSVEAAMGRMACMATADHSEDIVWTTDYGKMLGVAIGSGSHSRVWLWWIAVHHNIIFPGTPMTMGRTPASLMKGAPMPTTSASASPSMMASSSPKASSSPSMSTSAG
jgi:serine/threonine protein kinase